MKKLLISVVILLVLITSCAPGSDLEVTTPESTIELRSPGPNPQLNQPDEGGRLSGFVQGLWHGIIAPVMVVGSFFNPAMQIYEVHNNGRDYNLGFLIGIAFVFLLLGLIGGRWR
ncbi:MAG TPA: hypothetical protein VFG81_08505 [Anaerolineales bacterium]|jgi:hypothetical protein|nr:hypothetical protein [Anaerolineales bacterium]